MAVVEPKPDTTTARSATCTGSIFDRYGSDLLVRAAVRRSRTTCRAWLREQGFTVLDKSHANYVRTGVSIPTTMSMTHLKDIAGMPGPDSTDLRPVQAPDAELARRPPIQDARVPLLPHRLVVDAQRPRRRGRRQPQRPWPVRLRVGALRRERGARGHQAAAARTTARPNAATATTGTTPTGWTRWAAWSTSPVPSSCSATSCSPTRPPSSIAMAAS